LSVRISGCQLTPPQKKPVACAFLDAPEPPAWRLRAVSPHRRVAAQEGHPLTTPVQPKSRALSGLAQGNHIDYACIFGHIPGGCNLFHYFMQHRIWRPRSDTGT